MEPGLETSHHVRRALRGDESSIDWLVGRFSPVLLAQARGTWQAMEDAGRWVLLATLPDLGEGSLADLRAFFEATERSLATGRLPNGQE